MTPADRRPVALIGTTITLLALALAGALVLELLSGGIRVVALGPPLTAACVAGLGCVVAWHRPGNRVGSLMMVTGTGFAAGTLAAAVLDFGSVHPIPRLAAEACFAAVSMTVPLVAAWSLYILWFPDGRFTSRAWQRFFVAAVALCVVAGVALWLLGPAGQVFDLYRGTHVPPGIGGPFAGTWPSLEHLMGLVLLLPLVALGSLVQRYRRSSGVLRQQIRWLLAALAVAVAAQVLGAALESATGRVSTPATLLEAAAARLPTVAATLAILRFRLWDIDVVLSRAVVYALLWAGLSGLLLVPSLTAGLLVGGPGAAAAVGIALLVTIVFQPARRRLESLAERVVYSHRVGPYRLLSGFWAVLRHADLERFGPVVADAMRTGLAVEWAGVWRYDGGRGGGVLRPMSGTPARTDKTCPVSSSTAGRLLAAPAQVLGDDPPATLAQLWPAAPEAVLPLAAGGRLLGVIACGGRRGDRLRAADFEALELLAREASLRLQNLQLEAQLRDRLAQIEQQAAELRASRNRLVRAQHEERRRIERNLHDGVQQQLVSLVVRLQRAAENGEPPLADLAAEAERAMFALQELGRGIYPSVLVDRGLPAALRTQAARMPIPVHIEVDAALAGRRLDRETEAACYFVALEALTNAQKHAPGAAVRICLWEEPGLVHLEVVDDGPGLPADRGAGSGLQNMRDRVAAAGGSLQLHSCPGRGTRVTAAVPTGRAPGPALPQPVEADSRR